MADQYWKLKPGLNNAASYQVSGMPFASGSIAATSATQVRFPSVTKWIQIINKTKNPLTVAFSRAGANGTPSNYNFADVIAGLTTISTGSVSMSPATPATSASWSGSAGVG